MPEGPDTIEMRASPVLPYGWGRKEKGHTLTAKYLNEHYGISPWWAQAATIRYEWERGIRKQTVQ